MAFHPAAADRQARGLPDADNEHATKFRRLNNETSAAFAALAPAAYGDAMTGEKCAINLKAELDPLTIKAHLLEPAVRTQFKLTIAE
jgi:hypothetical protein